MKKPASKIRAEIARLQEQLRHAETREAERIGRIALKAGLGEIEIDEAELQTTFEDLAKRFLADNDGSVGKARGGAQRSDRVQSTPVTPVTVESHTGEA